LCLNIDNRGTVKERGGFEERKVNGSVLVGIMNFDSDDFFLELFRVPPRKIPVNSQANEHLMICLPDPLLNININTRK
jgi:hypothetical protein